MAKYDPQWDRVVRAIRDHYVMYDKVREINIRQDVKAMQKNLHELKSDIRETKRLESFRETKKLLEDK